jgi:hypothetical protein
MTGYFFPEACCKNFQLCLIVSHQLNVILSQRKLNPMMDSEMPQNDIVDIECQPLPAAISVHVVSTLISAEGG